MSTTVKSFVFNMVSENTYLLIDDITRESVIIDPGCMNKMEQEQFDLSIASLNTKPVALLLTHLHFDHVLGVPYIAEKYGLNPFAHPDEIAFSANSFIEQIRIFGLPQNFNRIEPSYKPILPGQKIFYGENVLDILFVPGHSIAHLAFYNKKERFVFVGDVLFHMSIGRTDLPGGNSEILYKSIENEIYSLPDDTIVYPGHGPCTSIGYEKNNNPYIT